MQGLLIDQKVELIPVILLLLTESNFFIYYKQVTINHQRPFNVPLKLPQLQKGQKQEEPRKKKEHFLGPSVHFSAAQENPKQLKTKSYELLAIDY